MHISRKHAWAGGIAAALIVLTACGTGNPSKPEAPAQTVTVTAPASSTSTTAPATKPSAPASPPTTTKPSAPAATQGDPTVSEQQAQLSAMNYLSDGMGFSRQGLIDQLKYEGFSVADATWGVDHSFAKWNEQAIQSANNYLSGDMGFSRHSLIEQLRYEGFTEAQAEYAVAQAGL